MATISGLINARLRSTRLPQKLIRPFAGTTLIDIALQKLAKMDFFEHRYFGAAEDELIDRCDEFENITLLRRDLKSVEPGYNDHRVIYAHYEQIASDYICWINPCHALLSVDTLRSVCEHVQETLHNSYTSVVPTRDWIFSGDGVSITNTTTIASTNHSPIFYRVAHGFHIFKKETFLQNYQFWSMEKNDPAIFEIPIEETFDVDTKRDFMLAELAYKEKYKLDVS